MRKKDRAERLDRALILGLMLAALLLPLWNFWKECGQIRQEVFRLHILAASDSDQDQQNKLAVRDALLAESETLFEGASTLSQAELQASEKLREIERIAETTLKQRGCGDPVKAELVHMYFGTRVYEDVTLPAGEYDALRLTIGKGQGQNWWCVMFPPLCVGAAADPDPELTQEIRDLSQQQPYRLSFAVVEAGGGIWGRFFGEGNPGEGDSQKAGVSTAPDQ